MTPEEAKENLEKLLLLYDDGMIDFRVIRESVKVAIEALQDSPTQMSGTSDLISRKAVIDALDKRFDSVPMEQTTEILMLRKDLRELPSAEPERRTGKWLIRRFGGDAQCSECGMYFRDAYDFENSDHYCRHCGAEMEGTALKLNG